jgi:catecholate siderophore receptor
MPSRRLSTLSTGTAIALVLAAPAFGQEPRRTPPERQEASTPAPHRPIPQIIVEGQRLGAFKIDESALGKLTEPLHDVPQSIATISREVIEQRGMTNLNDAFRAVPGITLGASEFNWQGNNPNIRGFNARSDMFLDGMRDFGNYFRDPFDLESIEVLQGPASTVFGRGSTGGVINQNTRRANLTPSTFGALNVGTDATKRVVADVNEPLSELGEGAAARLVAMGHSGHVAGRDGGKQERYGFAPSLALGLGTPTRLTLDYLHLSSNDVPDYGLPWFGTEVAPVPRDNFYGFKSDYLKTDVDMVTGRLDHDFSDHLRLHTQVRYGSYRRDNRITEPQIAAAAGTPVSGVTVNRNVYTGHGKETFLQGQADLTAHLVTGPLDHTLVTGFEAGRETSKPVIGFAQGVPGTSLLNPDETARFVSTGTPPSLTADTRSRSVGVYALDTLKIGERLQIVGGVRWDYFDVDYSASRFTTATGAFVGSEAIGHTDREFSYRGALVFKPVPAGSVYVAYGTSFNPSAETLTFVTSARGSFPIGNAFLDPETNRNYEVGTKWDLLDNRLAANAALFRIVKENARVPNPATPGFNTLGGTQRSQGVDVSLTGRFTERWQVTAGYVYLDGEVTRSPAGVASAPAVGAPLPFAPKHSFSFWTSYLLTDKVQIGGGGQHVGSRYASNTAPIRRVPGYWTFDAMLRYLWSEHLSFKVNLTNLADKYYYDAIHPQHVIPGAGRTAMFAINVSS